jgi:hypothetical protein
MASGEFPKAIHGTRWTSQNRLIGQVPLNIGGQFRSRSVAAGPVLLEGLHQDPIEIASKLAQEPRDVRSSVFDSSGGGVAQSAKTDARFRGILVTDLAAPIVKACKMRLLYTKRFGPDQQLVQQDAK